MPLCHIRKQCSEDVDYNKINDFYNFTKTCREKKHVETILIVLKIWAGANFAFCRFTLIDGLRQIDWE